MTAHLEAERARLSQLSFIDWIRRDRSSADMLPVWWSVRKPGTELTVSCALVPTARVQKSLEATKWDLKIGRGHPGFVQRSGPSGLRTEYHRFGGEDDAEPLVLYRDFAGVRPPYVEVSEELRLYHNLFYDPLSKKHFKIDSAGNELEIISTEPDRILVRTLEIRQYAAARDLHFALYFDNREHSRLSLAELGLAKGTNDTRGPLMTWDLTYGELDGIDEWITSSRLLGKRLFPPLPIEHCGIWPFNDKPRPRIHFVVGVDESGAELLDCSAECGGRLEYLTPVWFRKSVLDKYFAQPGKYAVEDGYVRCGRLWGMEMDNHHADYVVAWLGDLNRDLPHEEQLHWRSHNIPRCGPMSKVFFGRQLDCQCIDSDQPEHIFRARYDGVIRTSDERLGWRLLMPLSAEDQHYLSAVRVPASDDQKEFDDLVLALTKILIDSLNENELLKLIPSEIAKGLRGSIAVLEAAFAARGVDNAAAVISFLRGLQNLRSTGSAHRKGDNYQKAAAKLGVGATNLRDVFRAILTRGVQYLELLMAVVQNGSLSLKPRSP